MTPSPDIADLLATCAEHRAQNKPWKTITDAELGVLAGRDVAHRLMTDGKSGAVWFVGVDGEARMFDGFGMADPPFVLNPMSPGQTHLAGVTAISERATFFGGTGRGRRVTDLTRCGEHVLFLSRPLAKSGHERHLLTFPDEAGAIAAVAAMRASLRARRCVESSPWYADRLGTIQRCYTPLAHDGIGFDREPDWEGDRYADEAEQAARADAATLDLLRGGSIPYRLGFDPRGLLPRDLPVSEWMIRRSRDGSRDIVWRARACERFAEYVSAHGFPVAASAVTGTGAPEEEIAAYERARGTEVPPELRELWLRVGSASWTVGEDTARILSPSETLAHGRISVKDERMDVLVAGRDDEPIMGFVPDRVDEDGRYYAEFASDRPSGLKYWTDLRLSISYTFGRRMADAITSAFPLATVLHHGMTYDPSLRWRRFTKREDRWTHVWETYADVGNRLWATRAGNTVNGLVTTIERMPSGQVASRAASAIRAKVKAGYVEEPRP